MMSIAAPPRLMTTEELLALPDDGVRRELIRGELRENPVSYRSPQHAHSVSCTCRHLGNWAELLPPPRGQVLTGDVGFRIRRNPDTTVGMDVAYISAELVASIPANARVIDGVPILAVEVLSPSNRWETVVEKIRDYLECGIPLVWILDPVFRTVTVYRPGAEPALFNASAELTGEPHLPGFRIAVARLFGG
jgi:Uma2 family endonuclease